MATVWVVTSEDDGQVAVEGVFSSHESAVLRLWSAMINAGLEEARALELEAEMKEDEVFGLLDLETEGCGSATWRYQIAGVRA